MGTFYNKAPVQAFKENGYPNLYLDFAGSKSLRDSITKRTDLVTFTRSSTATYKGEAGLLTSSASNQPRFEFDQITGESLGFLIESQRTNLVTRSQDLSTGWTLSGATINSNAATAPDGTNTATKLIASTTQGITSNRAYISVSSANTTARSIWVKAGEADQILIRTDSGATSTSYVVFSLLDGSVVTTNGTPPSYYVSEKYPNGWWRLGIVDSTAITLFYVAVYGPNCDNGNGIYVWGAQVEEGSFETSYIPTAGSTATRAEDLVTILGDSFTGIYNEEQFSIFSEWKSGQTTDISGLSQVGVYSVTNAGGGGTRIATISGDPTNTYSYVIFDPVVLPVRQDDSFNKTMEVYVKGVSHSGSINGSAEVSSAYATIPTGIDRICLGRLNGYSGKLHGHMKKFAYWPTALPSGSLQTITEEGL